MPEVLKFIIAIIICLIIIWYYVNIIIPVREEIAEGERARKINRFIGSTTLERGADALQDSNTQEFNSTTIFNQIKK